MGPARNRSTSRDIIGRKAPCLRCERCASEMIAACARVGANAPNGGDGGSLSAAMPGEGVGILTIFLALLDDDDEQAANRGGLIGGKPAKPDCRVNGRAHDAPAKGHPTNSAGSIAAVTRFPLENCDEESRNNQ